MTTKFIANTIKIIYIVLMPLQSEWIASSIIINVLKLTLILYLKSKQKIFSPLKPSGANIVMSN